MERDALGIVFSPFRRKFTCEATINSLQIYLSQRKILTIGEKRLLRRIIFVAGFDYHINCCNQKDNGKAYSLSRLPERENSFKENAVMVSVCHEDALPYLKEDIKPFVLTSSVVILVSKQK